MNAKSAKEENKTKQGCPELPHFERDQGDNFEHVAWLSADSEYKKWSETRENLRHSQTKTVLYRLQKGIFSTYYAYKTYQKHKIDEKKTT